jgi:Tol biopolymer transport system component
MALQGLPELIARGGMDAITPTTARKTNRIAWVNQLWDLNIYRVSASGSGTPVRLIASTARDQGAEFSPDGSRIAFISDRSGSREIWIATADGERQTQVTNFSGPSLGNLQWSPDGRHLAFDARVDGRQSILILDCEPRALTCGRPRRLLTTDRAEHPSWSADGQFIYFASGPWGHSDLWKEPAGGGPAIRVTSGGGSVSRESRDGKWVYFSRIGSDGIWRISASQSGSRPSHKEDLVIQPSYEPEPAGWTLTSNEIFFVDRASEIRAYEIGTKKVRSILKMPDIFPDRSDIGLSVSPDSQWVLYSQVDRSGSNVMVAESVH